MDGSRRRKLIAATGAVLAVAGGGAAIAATQLGSSKDQERQPVVNDAARKLGVTPRALSDALKGALLDRVDAAVSAGRITKQQGEALKARIRAGVAPFLFGFRGPGEGRHFGEELGVAARYLGVTEDQLRADLRAGKSLAEIAGARGKSVDGLIDALYAAEKKELDEAVAAGRLTKEREQAILAHVRDRITAKVNGTLPRLGRHRDRFRGPAPFRGGPEHFRRFRPGTT